MLFFPPVYEFLPLVSCRFSENGEEDVSSAECSASTGNVESAVLIVIASVLCSSGVFLLPLRGRSFVLNAGIIRQEVTGHSFSIGVWGAGNLFTYKRKFFSQSYLRFC